MNSKIKLIQSELHSKKLGPFIVTNTVNIFYLTGFAGVSPTEREAILVIGKEPTLITAKLYEKEANKIQTDNLNVFIARERQEIPEAIKARLMGAKNVGFESHNLTFAEHKRFKKLAPKSKFVPVEDIVENFREIKSEEEIKNIKTAQILSQRALAEMIKTLKVGQTETEIAEKLKNLTRHFGAQGQAFEPIVASGPNSALPHYKTGNRKIKAGDTLLLDFGAKYKNYNADLSRTIFLGKATDQQRNIYSLVETAQKKALGKIKDQIPAKKVFEAAHSVFRAEKVDSHFVHSLGHGIGLEVHEKPSISEKSKDKLSKGKVFSIEPGLYFNWGGIRIEDLVTITNSKPRILGQSARFLEVKI